MAGLCRPAERLIEISHINDDPAVQLIAGRPGPSVNSLTGINGIGRGRIEDILEQDLACVGVRAPRGQRETIKGLAAVVDADTKDVAGERKRLIGIDAPEGKLLCQADGHDWPRGQIATVAVYEMVGGAPVSCEVYGRDRWGGRWPSASRAGQSLNAAILRAPLGVGAGAPSDSGHRCVSAEGAGDQRAIIRLGHSLTPGLYTRAQTSGSGAAAGGSLVATGILGKVALGTDSPWLGKMAGNQPTVSRWAKVWNLIPTAILGNWTARMKTAA